MLGNSKGALMSSSWADRTPLTGNKETYHRFIRSRRRRRHRTLSRPASPPGAVVGLSGCIRVLYICPALDEALCGRTLDLHGVPSGRKSFKPQSNKGLA